MTTASTTVGPFTLTGQTKSDGTIGYSLNSPDGSSYLGSGPLSLVAKPGVPNDSAGKPMTGYKYYSLGQDQYLLLTENEGATLAASLSSMVNTVNKEIASKEVVAAPAPAPAASPPVASAPTKVSTTASNAASTAPLKTQPPTLPPETSTPSIVAQYDKPITVKAEPLVIDEIGLNGKPTGKKIIVEPPKVPLPMGAAIEDIYDPNLTPEQVASLSPGDQKARAAYLKDSATYTGPVEDIVVVGARGLSGAEQSARASATAQDQANFNSFKDWRVRLSLAPGASYFYRTEPSGVLAPLAATDGVIFPYTPAITVSYAANYEGTSLTHTNYKIYQYQSSSVDQVQITCEFTAQDVKEANYVLAVIHFFRTMTKMFYGQDSDPKNGTPPPLCYLYGLGGYQFDALPLAISGFNYSLPQDVDYIKTTGASAAGTPQPPVKNNATSSERLGPNLTKGGKGAGPNYGATATSESTPTSWVPTKIQLSITCVPIMSRNAVSNKFSLKDYATGSLLNGTRNGATGGGFW